MRNRHLEAGAPATRPKAKAEIGAGLALIRSRLWELAVQIERSGFPTYGQVLTDQGAGARR